MTAEKKLLKSTAIISSGVMTSRILGFIRDILIAKFFGIGMSAQAFVYAFTLPNSLRNLIAEGAVDTVLVPVLTEYRTKRDRAEFWRLANVLFNVFLAILLFITILGVLLAPAIVRLIAPGFVKDIEKLNLTIALFKIMFPYLLLVGLTAYCMGNLHTFNHFTAPAFSTAILNTSIIVGILAFYPNVDIVYVAWAIIVGGILQLSAQFPPLLKRGPFFNFKAGIVHEDIPRIGKLLLPRVVGAAVYQINIIVDKILASLPLVGEGAVVALYYGNRLFQLPLAVFGISMATAALPTLSAQFVENRLDEFKRTISFSLKNMLFFSLPASVGLMVLSRPIIRILFERDEFTAYATDITSRVLFFYAVGLIAYGGVKILVSAFHSMKNTVTPVRVALFALLSNIVLNLILMVPLKSGGLALATSISGFINFSALYVILRWKIGQFGEKDILSFFIKVLISSLFMGLIACIIIKRILWGGLVRDVFNLILIIFTSILAYFVMTHVLRIRSIKRLFSWIEKE